MRLNKKGFTLVETIVTLSILLIVIGLSSMLILSGTDTLTRNSVTNAEKFIGDSICDWMQARVRYATKLTVAPAGSDKNGAGAFTVSDGRMLYADASNDFFNLYGDDFYFNHTVDYTAVLHQVFDGGKTVEMLTLTVNVYRPGQTAPVYTATADVRLLNMGLFNSYVTDSTLSGALNPVVSFSTESTAAGSADDPAVNELLIRTQLMREQYDLWLNRYNESGQSAEILNSFRNAFYLANNKSFNLLDTDYYHYLKTRLGDSWITFDDDVLSPLQIDNPDFYNYLTQRINLEVRVGFTALTDGRISGDSYCYAFNSGGQETMSYLLYNMRDQSWYYYCMPDAGGGYDGFSLSVMAQSGTDALYDQIESSPFWHKL